MSINGHKTNIREANVTEKKEKKIHINLITSLKRYTHSPEQKMSYTNSPSKYKITLNPKLLPFFVMNDKG